MLTSQPTRRVVAEPLHLLHPAPPNAPHDQERAVDDVPLAQPEPRPSREERQPATA